MDKQTKTIVLIVVAVVVIIFVLYFTLAFVTYQYVSEKLPGPKDMPTWMKFTIDKSEKTIIVEDIEAESKYLPLSWSDISITNGTATFPIGTIDIGDTITNCSGNLEFIYEPDNTLLFRFDFEE